MSSCKPHKAAENAVVRAQTSEPKRFMAENKTDGKKATILFRDAV